MKEIVVLSGKGGTGKTSIALGFLSLAGKCVIADCDVDAADMHVILQPLILETNDFIGGKEAEILQDRCTRCGKCYELCRFQAIKKEDGYLIDPLLCEGCGVCAQFCPEKAIVMKDALSGRWFFSQTRLGDFVHGKLGVSGENSGKLVTLVRKRAKERALEMGADYIIVDGSPGIGCPVIASITGTDYVVVVTEPTVSGKHDLLRLLGVIKHFGVKSGIIVNRYDINREITEEIYNEARSFGMDLLGSVPFDRDVVNAQLAGKTVLEHSSGNISALIAEIWEKICQNL